MMIRRRQRCNIEQCQMHAFRPYILPKFKRAAARSLCDSWASCYLWRTPHFLWPNICSL